MHTLYQLQERHEPTFREKPITTPLNITSTGMVRR